MDSKRCFTVETLTDDLVVEILCRVPFESFCRFKCVCKAWLAFSSDQHYRQKLPKIPSLLLGCKYYIQRVSLSPNDEEIDGALTFLPRREHIELVDCCNGLVLCKYTDAPPDICRFILCNPATREWRMLPDTHTDQYETWSGCKSILAFDPSWSAHFYVFNFQENRYKVWPFGFGKLEVFSSNLSTWVVDNDWRSMIEVEKPHIFIGGVLHVQTNGREILVLEGLEAMGSGIQPHGFTIKMPEDRYGLANGCFGQSSGFLLCAFPEEGGHRVAVWGLDSYRPCEWSRKHFLSLQNALGRDYFDRIGYWHMLSCWRGYQILSLDLEREVLFLLDREAKKLLSYNISKGKLSEIHCSCPPWNTIFFRLPFWKCNYYVACYTKLPG
uniref:Uncharacterized protein n=1 Tax=Avena sativa TaxID=4498 RepID=A0ACD5T7C3_AVESA